ncbi:hypothetical protein D9758_012987 [Tetrapyrgos nigripes]|uniref:Rhamnogalacturonan lyase domain-containing protein n=1 Tax=Tetrapyrgos nigripes TaxID=182062 RepID=A0A8H5CKT3_9AGAR|nr:hypothetical protein D9758_012987 [Tetrapyrgos nigripes]
MFCIKLALRSQSVTVSAGGMTTSNITSMFSVSRIRPQTDKIKQSLIWQIGDLDGIPRGFLNADPSDTCMSRWGPVTFTVGQAVSSFPMAIFKTSGCLIPKPLYNQSKGSRLHHFTLNSSQGSARTLDIFTTLAFTGARPQITLNSFTGAIPAVPSQPDLCGVTHAAGTLKTDGSTNVLTINAISGSGGDRFLYEAEE